MARFFPALAAAALFLCAARIGVINALEGDACDFYAHAIGGMKCTLGLPGRALPGTCEGSYRVKTQG